MKKYSSIENWLKSSPNDDEKAKILILINRGLASKIRREIWEKEQYLRKLNAFSNHCKKLGFAVPKDETDALNRTKKEISELQKQLPPVIPKKGKVIKEELPQELESAALSGE